MDAATLQALIAAAQSGNPALVSTHIVRWDPS